MGLNKGHAFKEFQLFLVVLLHLMTNQITFHMINI